MINDVIIHPKYGDFVAKMAWMYMLEKNNNRDHRDRPQSAWTVSFRCLLLTAWISCGQHCVDDSLGRGCHFFHGGFTYFFRRWWFIWLPHRLAHWSHRAWHTKWCQMYRNGVTLHCAAAIVIRASRFLQLPPLYNTGTAVTPPMSYFYPLTGHRDRQRSYLWHHSLLQWHHTCSNDVTFCSNDVTFCSSDITLCSNDVIFSLTIRRSDTIRR